MFSRKKFKAFHIKTYIDTFGLKFDVKDIDIYKEDYYAIGSGSERLKQKVINNGKFSYELVKELIAEDKKGVGGFYQRAWAIKGFIKLYADTTITGPTNFSFCGFNTLIQLGKFHFIDLPKNVSED